MPVPNTLGCRYESPTTRPKHANATVRGTRPYRRLNLGRIRRRISVYLARVPSGLPPIRCHPFSVESCASFMRLYGPRWTATAAWPPFAFRSRGNDRLSLAGTLYYQRIWL
jgi:hypothetical protein